MEIWVELIFRTGGLGVIKSRTFFITQKLINTRTYNKHLENKQQFMPSCIYTVS